MIFNILKNKITHEKETDLRQEYLKVKENDNIYGFQKKIL